MGISPNSLTANYAIKLVQPLCLSAVIDQIQSKEIKPVAAQQSEYNNGKAQKQAKHRHNMADVIADAKRTCF